MIQKEGPETEEKTKTVKKRREEKPVLEIYSSDEDIFSKPLSPAEVAPQRRRGMIARMDDLG